MTDQESMTRAAYRMQAAYIETGTLHEAVDVIMKEGSPVNQDILSGMWMAIDAYADMLLEND